MWDCNKGLAEILQESLGDGYSRPTAPLSSGYTRAFQLPKGTGTYHKMACSWSLGSKVRDHYSCRHSSGTCQRPQHTTCHPCLFKSLRKNQEHGIRGYFLWIQFQFEKVLGDGWWKWLYNNVSVLNATELYTQKWLQWQVLRLLYILFVKVVSRVPLFATPWTVQSTEFSRLEYWSGEPFPSPGDLPNPGIKPRSPTLQVDSLPAELWRKPKGTGVDSLSLL